MVYVFLLYELVGGFHVILSGCGLVVWILGSTAARCPLVPLMNTRVRDLVAWLHLVGLV